MVRKVFLSFAIIAPLTVLGLSRIWPGAMWLMLIVGPIVILGLHDLIQRSHSLLRVYPVIGHGRFLMEELRPEIQQYFVESNLDGAPFNREMRALVYQRAKGQLETQAFGSQRDVQAIGYEWVNHSLSPRHLDIVTCRLDLGGAECTQPYSTSYLNISAMSFGSLSHTAVEALNRGAAAGNFAHNTGEGGISPYHLAGGGDLIWQVGTGYFGCRAADGGFDPGRYAENAGRPEVKVIELKLSQGAKPGHGGILPAAKVTREISEIRGVPMGIDVVSPAAHTAFDGPTGLLEFIATLRELSNGKPVGFKLCIGHRSEFLGICKAMLETGITPDFITIDGTEGGTGAAPVELSNVVGTCMRDGLVFTRDALIGTGLRDKIKLIAAGKIVTGFDMVRTLALGADLCNTARPMMFALGCIQARRCNDNHCPVGVATQDRVRAAAIDIDLKYQRVYSYHRRTIETFAEIVGIVGLEHPEQVDGRHVMRRMGVDLVHNFDEVYAPLETGALLGPRIPTDWKADWERARPDRF